MIDVKPWVMHAEVADKYICCDNRILLVGDAAHRFPPAGGFGMLHFHYLSPYFVSTKLFFCLRHCVSYFISNHCLLIDVSGIFSMEQIYLCIFRSILLTYIEICGDFIYNLTYIFVVLIGCTYYGIFKSSLRIVRHVLYYMRI